MKFGWQKIEINYLTDKIHNRRSRGCNVNAAPLGTFFQESHSCLLLVEPFQRHTLFCPAQTGPLSSDPSWGVGMSQLCMLLAETSFRDSASCFAPHVRLFGRGDIGQIIWLSPIPRTNSSLGFLTLCQYPDHLRHTNPPNAQCNKCKLFSIRLTGAFSFPSLGAFFPWLKAYPAEQVTAATLHLYPLERPSRLWALKLQQQIRENLNKGCYHS